MPTPMEYQLATEEFRAFLLASRDELMQQTTHQTYTIVQSVFQVFRRRVAPQMFLDFINFMPVGIRALFVADWDLSEARRPFSDMETMGAEVRLLRPDHNMAPENCIPCIARSLRHVVNPVDYSAAMQVLPEEARGFWAG
jgi:uncharacterized protein (DUF2267 family)